MIITNLTLHVYIVRSFNKVAVQCSLFLSMFPSPFPLLSYFQEVVNAAAEDVNDINLSEDGSWEPHKPGKKESSKSVHVI